VIIYSETRRRFLDDVDHNRLHSRLTEAFRLRTGGVPADQRVWADEYGRFSLALRQAKVADDIQVALEYHISAAGRFRVDVLLAGNDGKIDNGMIVELKAWDTADVSTIPDLVFAPVGGGKLVQHPCEQARRYRAMLVRFNEDVRDSGMGLYSAAYLFNLHRRIPEPLEDPRYQEIIADSRLFLADDVPALRSFLETHLRHKPRRDLLFLLENGRITPAPALIERVGSMLAGNEEFVLLDEQFEAFQIIRHSILGPTTDPGRQVFIVQGGPGTGKSVMAVRLLAELLQQRRVGFLVAPNQAFRETLIQSLAGREREARDDGQALIRSARAFIDVDYDTSREIDVLIVDEAHRLKDKAYMYRGDSMVEDMVRAARVSVFFVDETQRVTWDDTGGDERIRRAAQRFKANVREPLTLRAQFRCGGSDGYLNWLDDVLQIRATANYDHWADGTYAFDVFDRAEDLHAALNAHNGDNKARLIAGYSWEWPKKSRASDTAAAHVVADGLSLPWNYADRNWATDPDAINQVGCVHTSQGSEFDWVGVLIGQDLRCEGGKIVGDPSRRAKSDKSLKGWQKALRDAGTDSADRERVLQRVQQIIKNTYKVLLTRGRRGCFVWCADARLREYFRERLRLAGRSRGVPVPEVAISSVDAPTRTPPPGFTTTSPGSSGPTDLIPVYTLAAAAGGYGEDVVPEVSGWAPTPTGLRPDAKHFIAKVMGHSMEPLIPDGSWCVFRFDVTGSRSGRILLVQHESISDPDTGGAYTIKRYTSRKTAIPAGEQGAWEHRAIELVPLNRDYRTIVIPADHAGSLRVIAEFVRVLPLDE
jgi:DUF2075 family protein